MNDTVNRGIGYPMYAQPMKTILLLDDEPSVLQIAAMILRRTGEWEILEASSLQEAADRAKSHVDLVIADVCVDKQAPSAVAAELRLLYPHARVLFMSGYPEDHLLGDGLLEHGAAFLAKPFFPDVLLRCVRNILDPETAAPRTLRAAG
jgi:two-component system, cell cycle sensor histidine kinase and response regulator CckA